MNIGKTGIYMRLSRDDEKAGESMSIENQRAILLKFVCENGGTLVDEYADDGWSGTDFDRPGIRRLLDDAKSGRVDTIIVKDLSRFGRNYIQVGQYIDYIFPAYGIRFIALADNVDTADRSSAGMDMMPIMNVFNEWHAASTSKKIRAVLDANWRRGKYTNWAYPYGYRAGTDENRTAVIDEEAAGVVRRIYDMRLQGRSARAIARTLTDEGIPNPASHYTRLDGKKSARCGTPYWSPKTVSDILGDSTYIGTLTQHRTTRFSYKNHRVINVPESEQIVRENAHDPIIDRDVWEGVQAIGRGVSRGRADKTNKIHPLSGFLVCADCGKKLKGKSVKGKSYMYCCRTYVDLGKKYCTSHSITERQIESIVLQDIRSVLNGADADHKKAEEHFLRGKARRDEQNRISAEKKLRALKGRLAELEHLVQSAFEEKVLGDLPEDICKNLCEKYQAEAESVRRQICELEKNFTVRETEGDGAEEYIAKLRYCLKCEELTREMCLNLIEFITVGERPEGDGARQIHIYYKLMPGGSTFVENDCRP